MPFESPLSETLLRRIASYIDEHYVALRQAAVYAPQRNRSRVDADFCCGAVMEATVAFPPPLPKATSLPEFLKQADAGFSQTLLRLIDQSGKKDSQIYKKANLSKQHFSKIRNNPDYKPTKQTALALALALELDLDQTKDLIGRAGYALSNSSKFDLIIRFFIEQGIYDVMQINLALYEFDQSLLGS